ncbi:hypothetical protein ACFVS2_25960 [Brevibacillus sp. NPDC058079]|uniref:hypothetical protein n=1 Tax=Brevibacillus sp. NPDC058079 TaxID=3346330 RepID=UPI0036E89118
MIPMLIIATIIFRTCLKNKEAFKAEYQSIGIFLILSVVGGVMTSVLLMLPMASIDYKEKTIEIYEIKSMITNSDAYIIETTNAETLKINKDLVELKIAMGMNKHILIKSEREPELVFLQKLIDYYIIFYPGNMKYKYILTTT